MSIEAVFSSLLNVSGITTLVGANRAMVKLPQGATYPALVWTPISAVPEPPINAPAQSQLVRARVQVTALARTLAEVRQVQDAVRAAVEYQHGSIAGTDVVSITRELIGPYDSDETARMWSQPVDFLVLYYDPPV